MVVVSESKGDSGAGEWRRTARVKVFGQGSEGENGTASMFSAFFQ